MKKYFISIGCALLFLFLSSESFAQKIFKPVNKKIEIRYIKPTTPGDGPTLYLKFLNAVNKTQTYTIKGNVPLLQLESEKPDGSIISLRNLQDNLSVIFNMTITSGKELIISQVGVTGTGWTMRVNDGPEIPLTNKAALKL